MKTNRKFVKEEAVSPIIGIVLMVAITIAIAATVYVYVGGMLDMTATTTDVVPDVQFMRQSDSLIVYRCNSVIDWSNITVSGTATKPSGSVDAGDSISDCSGDVSVAIDGLLIGSWTFT